MISTLHLTVILLRMLGLFFQIFPKLFNKVWHEGFLFKLKTYDVKGKLLKLLRNYLHEHNQGVVLNGQISSCELIKSGVPRGSVLGPLLFLIYIKDLPDNIQWKMQFNPNPNKQAQEVYFSKKSNNENSLPVTFNNAKIVTCSTHKHLGLLLDKRLSFNEHIQSKMNKCYEMIGVIKSLSVNLHCNNWCYSRNITRTLIP